MPSDVALVTLGELTISDAPITYGVVKPGPEDSNGVLFIRGGDISDGRILTEQLRTISREVSDQYRRTLLRGGELLVSLVGNPGQVAIVPPSLKGANIARQAALVRLRPDADTRYVKYFLSSPIGQAALGAHTRGSVQQVINLRDLKTVQVPILPLPEQRQIGQFFGALDDRIDLLRQTNATFESIAQALFKSWFADFDPVRAKQAGREPEGMDAATAALFPAEFEESTMGLIPKGWRRGRLADIAAFQNGYAFKSKDWASFGHPVVKIGDVKPGIVDLAGCSYVSPQTVAGLERFRLERGDLLVGMTGYVGETGLVPGSTVVAYLNQRVGRIATGQGIAGLGYVYCLVRAPAFKAFAVTKAHGSAQANVSGASLMSYPMILPSQAVLDAFNALLKSLLEALLLNHDFGQSLASTRDEILPRLISGKLRLPEAQEQLEEAPA